MSKDYEDIFNTIYDAIYILNQAGEFIHVNHGAELMYGYRQEEFYGKTPAFVSAPGRNDIKKVMGYLKKAYHGENVQFEFWGLRKNGEIFPKRVSLYPGNFQGEKVVIAVGQDITEFKEAEAKIRDSEERYRQLFDFSPVGLSLLDSKGFILDVNETLCSKMGYTREELIGKSIKILVTDENINEVDQNISRLLRGEILKSSLKSKRKDGGLEHILLSERRIKLPNGKWGILNVSYYITDLVKTKKLLEEREKTYQNLTEMLPDAVVVHSEGKIIYANRAAVKIIGANSREDTIGIPVLSVMHPDSLEFARERIFYMMKTGKPVPPAEEKLIRLDGKDIIAEISAMPITYKGKDAVITVIRDITKEKEVLKDLTRAKEKAEESDRLKTAFLQNMSHEIRTPLNAIIGFGDLIANNITEDAGQISGYGQIIKSNGKRLLELINNILEVSKIESGITELKKSHVNLNALMDEVYRTYSVEVEAKGLEFKLTKGLSDHESSFNLDTTKLVQVLNNLIGNAIKFTTKGSISFGYETKNSMLEFFVSDTGRGISDENREKIFQRFYQADNSFIRDYEGAGLGLSIVKGLINLMGGDISVSSEIGKGTTFRFKIPADKYTAPEIRRAKANDRSNNQKINVLLAEDDDSAMYLIKAMLHKNQFVIYTVKNGIEAIEMINQHPEIDIVLIDIKMPKLNGIEATKEIKNIRPALPVIATTAYAYDNEIKQIKEAGCDAVVTKPIMRNELYKALQSVCEKF